MQILRFILASIFSSIVAFLPIDSSAHSKDSYNGVDAEKFMRRYCLWVNAEVKGIPEVVAAINDLIDELKNIEIGLGGMGLRLTSPANCSPDINFGAHLNVPGIEALAACFNGLNFRIQLPNFDGLASCLQGLLPSLNVTLPGFDAEAMLACMTKIDFQLDLPAIVSNLAAILRAVMKVIAKLRRLRARVLAKFDPSFGAAIKALAATCAQAHLKTSKGVFE